MSNECIEVRNDSNDSWEIAVETSSQIRDDGVDTVMRKRVRVQRTKYYHLKRPFRNSRKQAVHRSKEVDWQLIFF